MSGTIDQWSSNDNTYGHGIICKNCMVRKVTEPESSVQCVRIGTFVQVHSIREDNVFFFIVKNDMQVETDRLVCARAALIYVPENLWGPLFPVEQSLRLSLVEDAKVAESMGNISVGHRVQVLGPDNKVICTGIVTFRNSIVRLGVGIYFGLKIESSKDNLQTVVKNVSLLEPGTKGFPRGCDIVVAVDKIRPINTYYNKEKLIYPYDKEIQRQKSPVADEVNGTCYKSMIVLNMKDKVSNNPKKSVHHTSSECNQSQGSLKKSINSDNPLLVGDRIVYLNGDIPERGVVRWMGNIKNHLKVGIEFDNPIGSGTGTVDGIELFRTKPHHALILPPMALIKLSDYTMNNTNDTFQYKNNVNYNNNNNNYNNLRSNEFCCDNKTTTDDKHRVVRSNSHQCLKHPDRSFYSDDTFQRNDEPHVGKQHSCLGTERPHVESACEPQLQHNSRSFDLSKPSDRKLGYRRQCNSVDNDLMQVKEPKSGHGNYHTFNNLSQRSPSQDVLDFVGPNWPKQERNHNCCWANKGNKNVEEAAYPPYKAAVNNHVSKEAMNIHFEKGIPSGIVCFRFICLFGTRASGPFRTAVKFVSLKKKKMVNTDDEYDFEFDKSYIPVTVLEHSRSRTRLPQGLCERPNKSTDGNSVYDVPSNSVRKVCPPGDINHSEEKLPVGGNWYDDSYSNNFFMGRRHTLAPSGLNGAIDEYKHFQGDVWNSHYSEHSSSNESIPSFYDSPKPATSEDLGLGSVVELTYKGEPYYGVIRWIGTIPDYRENGSSRLMAGIEMEEEESGLTDGTFNNKRYFQCNPKKGLFVPLSKCRKDSRFLDEKQSVTSKINYGQIDCPVVEGTIPPINTKGDVRSICGKNRGIQGHHNSCYLDATLFSMFAFTCVFDSLLYRPPTKNDIPQYTEVQRVLREEIVNPLRKNLYVRADRVMKLRTLLEKLSSVSGLTSEEKDPEEFLNSLLAQILKAEPFLKLSSGQEAFHYQLFVEKDERLTFPSVQQLFEQSFVTSDIKLKQVPPCLIIQMPRFGKSFKMYSKILPPQLLDVTDIIENSPRQCTVCGKSAEYECKDCFGQTGIGNGLESISFCRICLETAHNHHCRTRHNYKALTVPVEFSELQEHCIIPRLYMELFAVVCIETSHYVAFVKCGSGSDAPWCFFDSMADRKGEQNGYNIPEMVPCPELPYWLSEDGAKMLSEMREECHLPEHANRLFSDAYMCMYQSPDMMMYR